MKTIIVSSFAFFALAAPAFANGNNHGCRPGDTWDAGRQQCAHVERGGSRVPVAKRGHAHAPKVIVGAPVSNAGAIKIVTQHKFAGNVAQFRCSFTSDGRRIRHEGNTAGTGWCHD
jgi:hypothetical protein